MSRTWRWGELLLLGGGLVVLSAHPSTAAERELETGPPPNAADEIETRLQRAFLAPAPKEIQSEDTAGSEGG
jgi:hypothetical protein